jgi:hypothetical protein
VWKSGGLLEWFEEGRFTTISNKIKNEQYISECYVTEYDHTYMEVLYAKNDLLGSLGKRRRTTSVEMSTALPGMAAPPANVAAEMGTALPGIAATSAASKSAIDALGAKKAGEHVCARAVTESVRKRTGRRSSRSQQGEDEQANGDSENQLPRHEGERRGARAPAHFHGERAAVTSRLCACKQ